MGRYGRRQGRGRECVGGVLRDGVAIGSGIPFAMSKQISTRAGLSGASHVSWSLLKFQTRFVWMKSPDRDLDPDHVRVDLRIKALECVAVSHQLCTLKQRVHRDLDVIRYPKVTLVASIIWVALAEGIELNPYQVVTMLGMTSIGSMGIQPGHPQPYPSCLIDGSASTSCIHGGILPSDRCRGITSQIALRQVRIVRTLWDIFWH